jgi:signal transduction histidine kinase
LSQYINATRIEKFHQNYEKADSSEKIKLAIEMSEYLIPKYNDKHMAYVEESIALAIELRQNENLASLMILKAQLLKNTGNLEQAKQQLIDTEKYIQQVKSDFVYFRFYFAQAELLKYEGKIRDAFRSCEQALEKANSLKDSQKIANAKMELGNLHFLELSYDKSFEYQQEAYHLFESIKNEIGMGKTLVNLANIYSRTKKYDEAIQFYNDAMKLFTTPESKVFYTNALQNMAANYVYKQEYELAIQYHKEALEYFKEMDNKLKMAYTLYNIGNTYRRMDEYKQSTEFYLQALELNIANQYNKGIAINLIGLAENYLLQSNFEKCKHYLDLVEEQLQTSELPDYWNHYYNVLIEYYKLQGKYEPAFMALQKFMVYSDSLSRKTHTNQLLELQTEFQVEQKEKQIELLEKGKRIYHLKLLIMFIGLVAFVIIAILYRYRFLEKSKANREIKKHQDELEKINNEQNKLVKELQDLNFTKNKLISILAHDLKNGFTSLMKGTKLLSDNIHQLDAKTIPVIAEELHKSSVTMYEMLQNLITWAQLQNNRVMIEIREINLAQKVDSICQLMQPFAKEKRISLETTIPLEYTVLSDSPSLSSAIQNLIHNAIKFTHEEGIIKIKAKKVEQFIEISVSDNGIGMKEEQKAHLFDISKNNRSRGTKGEKGTGLGLIICKEFIELNHGSLSFTSELGKGTKFTILLPTKDND